MEFDKYREIIKYKKRVKGATLAAFGWDPKDDSKLDKLLKVLAQHKYDSLFFHTNGFLLKEKLSLKAYRRQFKLAIVLQSERLTIPAQNAILKTLEEPTQNTFLFLHTTNSLLLLPTIRSRCQIIELMDKSRQKKMAEPIINPLLGNPKMKIGQKIAAAKSIGSKDEALLLLNDLQSSSLENLRQDTQLFKLIQNIEEAKSAIKSNNLNVEPGS